MEHVNHAESNLVNDIENLQDQLIQLTAKSKQRKYQLVQLANSIANRGIAIPPTKEQISIKREAAHQEVVKQRRLRKSVRNKALAVATSKYDRRRVARGATALELLNRTT